MLGYSAYGMDIAPEAVICASSKMVDLSLDVVTEYVSKLRVKVPSGADIPPAVRSFFHRETLDQILGIRERLFRDLHSSDSNKRSCAIVTLAGLLGILHGHASYSLSISSSHAFSMSSAYVLRYAAEHGLKAPRQNVKECLIAKLTRCLKIGLPTPVNNLVMRGSALDCRRLFPELIGKVDLVLTSPPYLNAQTYAKDNWLRLWLLGYDYRQIQAEYIQTGSIQTYQAKMEDVFMELSAMMKRGGRLICVAGDVNRGNNGNRSPFKTGVLLARICESNGTGLKVENQERHRVLSKNRYLHSLSQSNGHDKHDLIERVFIARKH
jgi:hypothetical protein